MAGRGELNEGAVSADIGLKLGDLFLTCNGLVVTRRTSSPTSSNSSKAIGHATSGSNGAGVLSLDPPAGRLQGLELAERVSGSQLQPQRVR